MGTHIKFRSTLGAPDTEGTLTNSLPFDSAELGIVPTTRKSGAPLPDSQLATYFRDLAEHSLLSAEQELELARRLELAEVATWQALLGVRRLAKLTSAATRGYLEQPVDFRELADAHRGYRAPARSRALRADRQTALRASAKRTAQALRQYDLDRHAIDRVLRLSLEPGNVIVSATTATALATARAYYAQASAIREHFIRANLRLVVTMAKRFDRGAMPLPDLIQEGNLGLMHAVSRFDYRRGLRFSTYACWWIRHAIGRALADKARAVRIPVHMLEAQQQLQKVQHRLTATLGRPPTPQEVADEARLPLAKLNQMHRFLTGQALSLDRPAREDDERTFGDTLADPATDISMVDVLNTRALGQQVTQLVERLSPMEADVIRQRFGLSDDEELTFREIGNRYRLSRERIRQIQNAALDKLRKALEREHRGVLAL